ncbi:F-box protein containing LRR [Phytophthora cinnamomi]|uniref:F-box protein containing LRR n=1 Tax=Phytophthora cinnamomi TaxID=4785 RepID=UPI00355939AE|nr:F-box protein containing LRR [Phytophthora cinnamomi]
MDVEDYEDGVLQARMELLQRQQEHRMAAKLPESLMDHMKGATRHCQGDMKSFAAPPIELFCQDIRGKVMKREINLRSFTSVSNNWLAAIASHPAASGSGNCRALVLEGTSVTDLGIAHLHKLKYLTSLDISRCHAITDEGLNTIRRHLSLLQELYLNECHHFSSAVLSKVWKDCKRLHTLSVRGCPGVTDAFLQCIATTQRSSPACTLRWLDVRQCKNLTSSGISYLASSSVKDMAMHHLAVDDCLSVDNMAFFAFETSSGLRSLTSLSLSGLGIDETAVSWIVKGCGATLQRLNVARCKTLSDFALLLMAPLISSPVFIKLNMQDCRLITDIGIKNLFSIEEEKYQNATLDEDDDDDTPRTRLTSLNLKNCLNIGDDAMILVGKHGGNLVKLDLKGLRKVSDSGVLEIAKGCALLTNISLSGRNITAQTFKLLGKMCRSLRVLDISERHDLETPGCFMNLVSTTARGIRPPYPLRRIDLSGTNVCDTGVSVLAAACHQLECINLSKCAQITDFAAEALASRCFQLKILLLANTRGISDRTLTALAFTKIPLEVLDLSGNTRVTDEGLLALCTSCQQIQELRLKGCDRLSQKVVKRCNDYLLPFTKPFMTASLIKTIATGGGNSAMVLESLPKAHIELLRRIYRTRQARKIFEISKAVAALKAKEQYDKSLLGRLEARRNPMDELYRRAKLPREKEILTKLKENWESHKTMQERAVRKLKRECTAVWANADEIIGNQYGVHRKLYGVTENVYSTHRELEQRKKLHVSLDEELAGLKNQVRAFKRAMRDAVQNRRMLEGTEVFDLLKEHGLFLEPEPSNNQRDN